MHRSFSIGIMLMLLAAGCSQKSTTSSAPPDSAAVTNESQQPAPTTPPTAPAAEEKAPDLKALTLSLHHWIGRNQRLPKSFEEYAQGADIPIPPAPAGKKYAISKSWSIILVDQ